MKKWNGWQKAAVVALTIVVLLLILHTLGVHLWVAHAEAATADGAPQTQTAAAAGGKTSGVNVGTLGNSNVSLIVGTKNFNLCLGSCGPVVTAAFKSSQTYTDNPSLLTTKCSGATDQSGNCIPFEDTKTTTSKGSTGGGGSENTGSGGPGGYGGNSYGIGGGGGSIRTGTISVEEVW